MTYHWFLVQQQLRDNRVEKLLIGYDYLVHISRFVQLLKQILPRHLQHLKHNVKVDVLNQTQHFRADYVVLVDDLINLWWWHIRHLIKDTHWDMNRHCLPGMVRNFSISALWERHVAQVVYSMRFTRHKKLNILK